MKLRNKLYFIIGSIVITMSACVSNKKVSYLQYENELKKSTQITTDTIVRKYSVVETRYKLQPHDQLNIKIVSLTPDVYNPYALADRQLVSADQSSSGYVIGPSGTITLPVLGEIKAAGLQIDELEKAILSMVAAELKDPLVRIQLTNFRFTLLGEVGGAGTIYSQENSQNILQAISMAGGATEFADLSRVKVIRKAGNESHVFFVNLLDESILASEYFYVHPNDIIIISPAYSRELMKYVSPNLSRVASSLSLLVSLFTIFLLR
jgi:polysaccharide biosynthesis/export protein